MNVYEYIYSIRSDFPGGSVEPTRLTQEIGMSDIPAALSHINTEGDACSIFFKAPLSLEQKALLDRIVAAHDGKPEIAEVFGVYLEGQDGPLPEASERYRSLLWYQRGEGGSPDRLFICTKAEDGSYSWESRI
jgi:hypothetical protein